MLTSPFFRRLFLPYLLVIVFATAVVGVVAARIVRASYLDRQTQSLRNDVRVIAHATAPLVNSPAALDAHVKQIGAAVANRLTVIRADGTVIADSEADPAGMENHRQRPEFADAISRGEGVASRPSDTLHTDLLYLARPFRDLAGRPVTTTDGQACFIRLAVHLDELQQNLYGLYAGLATAALLAAAAAAAIAYLSARRSARPIADLTAFADALSHGDLSRRTLRDGDGTGEVATLANSLNTMAESLARLVEQANKDKAELLTILSSMSEGVIVTDMHHRILLVNDAAGKLLGFDPPSQAVGKHLWGVVRSEPILKAAEDVLFGEQRKLITVGPVAARHLDVTLCTFPADGQPHGLIIVAHDITQSFQYQELRKEFVANVSHELRTPLSVIRGFVETLQDGAWQDQRKAPEYLATIHRHTEQLTNLVSDLLELAKLESHAPPQHDIAARRGPVDLAGVIQKAAELIAPGAERKHQTMTIDVALDLPTIKGNADYIERAIANLIDNASKYTPNGGRITVTARANSQAVTVEVTDTGIGIPADDIPRIFERFYRVDRSRSREMGGTGLGLSIVKHVAQAHAGQIEVESTPGKGTTFRLRLPIG